MKTFSEIAAMRAWCRDQQSRAQTIGIVPTMGALHEGHLSLVRRAKSQCDLCVATIFVNPTQFAEGEDLSRYPRPLEQDLELLREEGADAVFLPTDAVMYPDGFGTYVNPPPVSLPLEGQSRPEHFRGVTTVVMKLFQIIPANAAFFGQKDFQQLRVIEHMVRDLNVPVEIVPCEIVREKDGLAMSSRNRYLSESERVTALSLSRALVKAAELVQGGEDRADELERTMYAELSACDKVDYAVVVDANSLQPVRRLDQSSVALIAARVGNTRLIDNRIL
ncbi:pantoate--beta-alanine ligase [Aporhodopirellula aestuarii]|uniref:Pantothenate synthetase n=1 Tax=Aporhodopirellula aestuarii TaxID=2950107 RepID=A0ABT0UAK0_9BACT|nr:pantoate--beta-alanine ligase [Aporhodopirellula aestuarii]MCM2374029.1 pantoate--beta-alanine ligase [Aporhodopirellula aestuarii]